MIRFARRGDHPQLKALWAEIFFDTADAVEAYFALRHLDENMLVEEREGAISGMLSMLPVTLAAMDGQAFAARYIYAVATHPAYRGQGISTALLTAAHAHIKSLGADAAILVPASASLFDFYAKRGYQTVFSLDVITLDASSLPAFPASGQYEACSAGEYARLRDQAFHESRLYARWEESAVAYAMSAFAEDGGVTRLVWEGGHGCAAWERTKNGVLVRELALLDGDIQTALSILHKACNARSYTVRLPEGTVPGAIKQPFGMIRWLAKEPALQGAPPYLSLALD